MKLLMTSLSLVLLFSANAFANDLVGRTTIEKILLQNQHGEEVESAICCSWVSPDARGDVRCVPTCMIEDGKMTISAALPPIDPPSDEFCRKNPGSNFCGGRH